MTGVTIRIRDATTAAAYQMMMIVAGSSLEPRRMSGRLDLANQLGINTC